MARELSKAVKDKVLSASFIKQYLECPYKFHKKYFEGIREPPRPAPLTGSVTHGIMEEFFKNPQRYEGMEFDEVWEAVAKRMVYVVKNAPVEIGDEAIQEAVRVTSGLFEYHGDWVFGLPIIASEVHIKKPIPGTDWEIQGTLDALLDDGTIFDWKTSSSKWSGSKKYQELQPKFYAYLALEPLGNSWVNGKSEEVAIPQQEPREFQFCILIKHKRLKPESYQRGPSMAIVIDKPNAMAVEELARYVVKNIEAENFQPTGPCTNGWCNFCYIRELGLCPLFKEEKE